MRLVELAVHQRELHRFVNATRGCSGCEFVERALAFLEIRVRTRGEDRLPHDSVPVICANHPTGGADGLALMSILCRRYGALRVPANDLLLVLPPLRDFLAPVDKHGSNWRRAASYGAMYDSQLPILVFPAGRTSRFRAGVLREYEWDKAFIKQARRRNRAIVPAHVSGRNSAHFYALWRLRRALRIRPNLEMFLLVDELFRKRGTRVDLTFGRAVDPGPPRGPAGDRALARRIRREVERGLPGDTQEDAT